MQKSVVFVLWVLFSLIFQTVTNPDFPSIWISADFLFYLIIILALRFNLSAGIAVTIAIGYISDSMSHVPYGTAIFSYLITLFLIRTVQANIYIDSKGALFFWILLFSSVKQSVEILYIIFSYGGYELGIFIFARIFLQSIWEALLGIILVPFIDKMMVHDFAGSLKKRKLRV